MDQLETLIHQELKILADLIMTPVYAKIGMIQALVHSVTVAYICMIGVITKLDGRCKKTLRNLSEKDGKEY